MKDDTKVVNLGRENLDRPGPVNPPVVRASTVVVRTIAERLELQQSDVSKALTRVRHHIRRRAVHLLREHAEGVEGG